MKRVVAIALMGVCTATTTGNAQSSLPDDRPSVNREEIIAACRDDRLVDLPNPYSDLPENHWAYNAVLRLTYCVSTTVQEGGAMEISPQGRSGRDPFSEQQ